MHLGLWKKLAIAMISATVMILALALYLSQQSVKQGFLAYINNTEATRIAALKERLIAEYEFHESWRFIEGQPRKWRNFIARSHPRPQRSPQNPRSKPYPLHNLATRGEHPSMPPHERAHIKERPNAHPMKRSKPPRSPGPKMSLLDVNKQRVVTNGKHTEFAIDEPIHFNTEIIGYIRVEPFREITESLDKEFINHQLKAFLKIALASLLFIIAGAWFIGRYLKKRLAALELQANELTAGNYATRSNSAKQDDIGQLATHLDTLASTLEKNQQSRQQWIADISHELRTPLAILKGETEALIDGIRPLNAQAVHSLASEIERLNHLVEDLYQLSLSDVGALSYTKTAIEITPLIDDIVESFSARLLKHQLQMTVDLEKCETTIITGDAKRLTQLFINLLENAIRYTDAGGKINISGDCTNNQLQIIIEDTVPTVTPEKLPHLFERLYRTETSRNRETGGAGLGLAICKEIVTAHQGQIEAKQSPLGGIAIHIRFPI